MSVYEALGVEPIINAAGTLTRLSGGVMRAEVAEAMAEASRSSVDMAELQAAASRRIAEVTGAEAGYVTSGASAGILLATAACLTGLAPGRMNALPDPATDRREVLVARSHRNGYDHAVRAAGARLIEVGLPDRVSGAGVRDAEPWEFAEAISERTAAIYYVATRDSQPELAALTALARERNVPVIVDAAAELPPQANLRRFIDLGADLVAFSGGKAIGGPQASGILAGRRDLIMAAALQHLDMDVLWDLWEPPSTLIDKTKLHGAPRHGIGRSCKTGKEEIVGLLRALDLFVAEGDAARHARWLIACRALVAGLDGVDVPVGLVGDDNDAVVPAVSLQFETVDRASTLASALQRQNPAVHVDVSGMAAGALRLNPMCLREGDAERVVAGIRKAID